jgi:hypothetical protein
MLCNTLVLSGLEYNYRVHLLGFGGLGVWGFGGLGVWGFGGLGVWMREGLQGGVWSVHF